MIDTKALRQKVLDLAIRGKLVPQDSNDEPASVLLERIRAQKQQMVKDGKLKAKDIKNDTVIFIGEDNLHYEKFADGTVKCIEDEIPFDLPDGWAWCRLPAITLDIFAGGDRPENYTKYATAKNTTPIYSNGVENEGLYGYTDNPRVIHPSVTISARGTIGKCFVRTEPFVPIIRLITITPVATICIDYLKIVFEILLETGTGSSIPQLTVPNISQKILPIPPVKEQIGICNICKNAFETIADIELFDDNLSEIIATCKSKILDLAIRGQLVPQDPNDEPASVLLNRIRVEKEELIKQGKIKRDKKESVIFKGEDNSYYEKIGDAVTCIDDEIPFDLPIDWQFVRLKDVCELISGRDLQPNEYNSEHRGIPYITGASNFSDDGVYIERWTNEPQVISEKGDLILTCKGTVGKMAFNTFGKAHIARQIMAIRNTFHINDMYLKICLEFYIEKIKDSAKGLIPGISRDDMLNLILPIPSLTYQTTIVCAVDQISKTLCDIEAGLS